MLFSNTLDKEIGRKLLEKNKEKEAKRIPSGKLSASQLGDPLQWQVLKYLNVPQKEIDEYTVRKFLRGNQIEEWFVGQMDNVVAQQKFVEYRNVVGYVDVVVDTKNWDIFKGIIPVEIKSVTNMKFKRIIKERTPQRGHILQATLYALALSCDWYSISYVASDDLRVETMVLERKESEKEVDKIITFFNETINKKLIPYFEANEKWQENKLYSKYPDWQELTETELNIRAKELYAKKEI